MTARQLDTSTRAAALDTATDLGSHRPRRVLLVGVSDVVAAGLGALLASSPDLEVLGPDAVGRDLPRADVHVVDVVGILRDGDTAIAALAPRRAWPAVLAIAPDGRPDLARRALARGAHGLVSLQWPAAQVVATVVASTRSHFVRPDTLTCGWGPESGAGARGSHGEDMTPRELQVLRLIAEGASNDDIARCLFVSINTVKTYIRSTYRRIGVATRSQAMRWCFEHGLVECAVPAGWTDSTSTGGGVSSRALERRLG